MPDDTPKPPPSRGRPKTDAPGTSISAWIPVSEYDRLVKLARSQDESLSQLVRDLLKAKISI